ncbi:MAG: DUF3108 domain-containing protein [Gammaproteobacteria bacterium]|nr:DUF3108 domain-containing protein [Gammaproteobacteria bacterium]
MADPVHADGRPAAETVATAWPPEFTAHYHLYDRGVKVAEMLRSMEHAPDGSFVFRSETHTTGLFSLVRKDRVIEQSRWQFAEGTIRSLAYEYTRSGGHRDRNVAVQFNWESRRIINIINGDSWLMPAVPQVVDKLLYQFALMTDLRAGRSGLSYTVADGGKVKTYEIEALGEESIRSSLGNLHALKFRHQKVGDERITTIWCAPRYQYLPVQVEYQEKNGPKVRVVLDSVTGL